MLIGVLLFMSARPVTVRPRARFFATGMLFVIVVVAIFYLLRSRPYLIGQAEWPWLALHRISRIPLPAVLPGSSGGSPHAG